MKLIYGSLLLGLILGSQASAQAEPLSTHAKPAARATVAQSEDWIGFLGPRRDGLSRETHLLDEWEPDGPQLLWELACGSGFSSPVAAQGRLVLSHRVGDEELVDCVDSDTGKRFWRVGFPCAFKGEFINDHGPRATPWIDGERLYVHAVDGIMRCLSMQDGKTLWEADWPAEYELPEAWFGVVSSPLIHGNLLIINLGEPEAGSVAAFDKLTGKLVWKTAPSDSDHSPWGASCASPVLADVAGHARLLVLTGGKSKPPRGGLMVLDPMTGALDFSFPFRSREYYSVNGSSPLVIGDSVLITASYNVGSVCLDLSQPSVEAEAPSPGRAFHRVLWKDRRLGLQFGNPLLLGGKIYMANGSAGGAGSLIAVDPADGKTLAELALELSSSVQALDGAREVDSSSGEASLLWADGKLFCLGDDGSLFLIDVSGESPRVLSSAALFHARWAWTPPVIHQGLLYIRQTSTDAYTGSGTRLLCYDLRAAQ